MGKRTFKQLSYNDRLKLEGFLAAKLSTKEIAEILCVHPSTIYREIKRGTYEHLNSDWTTEMRYSPDIAEAKYQNNLRAKGSNLKIGKDIKLAEYIEDRIVNGKYSPGAVLGEIKEKKLNFSVTISKQTLYSYIEKGIFLYLSNEYLPVKCSRKQKKRQIRRQKRATAGTSIEKRPDIMDREEFGHWEMDTVVGKQGVSKHALLVLTERKTRKEIIFVLPDCTTKSVVDALNQMETEMGYSMFSKVFRTITVDNGSEFADAVGIATSVCSNLPRTKVYYCHAYCSWERGSNENANKLIRRHIPKGTNFDKLTQKDISQIENWINNYPREIFGWKCSKALFQEEMLRIS